MPTLQLKLWRIVLLNELELAAWFIHGDEQQNGTDIYWLDPMNDTLVPRGTLTATLRNRPMLLFEAWKGEGEARLLTGFLHEYNYAFAAKIVRNRVGAAIIYTPADQWGVFSRPTVGLLMGTNLEDRNRDDEFWAFLGIRSDYDL